MGSLCLRAFVLGLCCWFGVVMGAILVVSCEVFGYLDLLLPVCVIADCGFAWVCIICAGLNTFLYCVVGYLWVTIFTYSSLVCSNGFCVCRLLCV